MDLETAKKVVNEEWDSAFGRLAIATNIFALPKNDSQTTLSEILLCLERGSKFGRLNVVMEVAALTLYRRTGRTRQEGLPYEHPVLDPDDWRKYLVEKGFIK